MNYFEKSKTKLTAAFMGSVAFLSSCVSGSQNPEYASIYAFAKEHANKEGWQLASIGSFGFKGYSGPGFNIVYRGHDIFEITEARDVMIRNILSFVEQHRTNKKLIETVDLKNGQFSYRNIELTISFYIENYSREPDSIGLICFDENRIRYWRCDAAKNDLILVHTESINDALRLSPECKDKSIIYEDPAYPPLTPAT